MMLILNLLERDHLYWGSTFFYQKCILKLIELKLISIIIGYFNKSKVSSDSIWYLRFYGVEPLLSFSEFFKIDFGFENRFVSFSSLCDTFVAIPSALFESSETEFLDLPLNPVDPLQSLLLSVLLLSSSDSSCISTKLDLLDSLVFIK